MYSLIAEAHCFTSASAEYTLVNALFRQKPGAIAKPRIVSVSPQAEFGALCEATPVAEKHAMASAAAYDLAQRGHGLGLKAGEVYEILRHQWNLRCR